MNWFYWDPDPIAFVIPGIDLPVFTYGLFFVAGFILGYLLLIPLFARALQEYADTKKLARELADKLTWYVVIATMVGARLGHVIFYDLDRYLRHPLSILNTREGGLASHGGTLGVLLALYLFHRFPLKKFPSISFLKLLDIVVIPAALIGCFIRMGNFFNQEIVGIPSTMPWAVIFGHPAEGGPIAPRHPVQLYEAFSYLLIFVFLYTLWRKCGERLQAGLISGLFFFLTFGSRFLIEFWKAPQTAIIDQTYLSMGQLLSIPFIILGLVLIGYALKGTKPAVKKTF